MSNNYPQAEDPMIILLQAMMTGDTSGAIVDQEARGQQKLVHSDVLPKRMLYCTREQLESIGIVFGDDADDLFVRVTLPDGWSKQASDHNMWSHLVDEQGRKRAAIFYKAAFYDRDAHISLNRRYSCTVEPVCGYEDENYRSAEWVAVVKDCEDVIWKSETMRPQPHDNADREEWHKWYGGKDTLLEKAKSWLESNYPNYADETAYW